MRNICFISIVTIAAVLLGLLFWVCAHNSKLELRLLTTENRLRLILSTVERVGNSGQLSVYGRKDIDTLLLLFEYRSDLLEVRLEATDISSKGLHSLSTLPNLELLYLKSITLGDSEIDALCELDQLKELQIDCGNFEAEDSKRLKEALPRCVINEVIEKK